MTQNQNHIEPQPDFVTTDPQGNVVTNPNVTDWLNDRLSDPANTYAMDLLNRAGITLPEDDTHPLHEIYWALVVEYQLSRVIRAGSMLTNQRIIDSDTMLPRRDEVN